MNLSTSPTPISGGASAGTRHRLSVLVVEDDTDLRTELAELLRQEGYDVAEAGDGKEGLQILRDASIDVVLLDLWLPTMDGWSFRAAQREDALLRDVPVIVMTADNSPQARAIDANAIFQKPFGGDELCAKIGEVLADRGAEGKGATERVSQVVALLANAVGHEIASPLMTLISGLERLREGPRADGAGEAPNTEQLLDQCWRIASSLRTLRGLPCPARTRDGDVDLREVVRSAIARVRADDVTVAFDGEQPAWVRGDPMVLLYLCTALVQNAMEAVPPPSPVGALETSVRPKVDVRLGCSATEVVLDVRDSGAPIPEDELMHIFAVDSAGRERAWSAGLRFWFVRQIVEALGGAIEISNIEGGVRCCVRLSARDRPLRRGRK
jgi:DNA-binding response OmpR family regulator